jgi:predicted O-methyltransferase YrrM
VERVRAELLSSRGALFALLLGHPREFGGRAAGYADLFLERLLFTPPDYDTVTWGSMLTDLETRFGRDVSAILRERELLGLEEHTRRRLADIRDEDPFILNWASDSLLARLCYLTVRLLEPEVVVETGVAHGVSSAFILAALVKNGRGVLHSVDAPPLRSRAESFQGVVVDEESKERWRLHRGLSKRVLPGLLKELRTVDLFLHDSLHTRRNMRREFALVWPHLRDGGVILADDVERNAAFGELEERGPSLWRVVRDREREPLSGKPAPVMFGVAVKSVEAHISPPAGSRATSRAT